MQSVRKQYGYYVQGKQHFLDINLCLCDFVNTYVKLCREQLNKWFLDSLLQSAWQKNVATSTWRDLVKNLTTKPRHTSSFSLECTDFKIVIPWSPSGGRGCQGCRGQNSSKLKMMKIRNENPYKLDEIQNWASATSKITSWPHRPRKGLCKFLQKLYY